MEGGDIVVALDPGPVVPGKQRTNVRGNQGAGECPFRPKGAGRMSLYTQGNRESVI